MDPSSNACFTVAQANKERAKSAAYQREQQGYQEALLRLEAAIERTKQEIEEKKSELARARVVRQQNEEYEVRDDL